MKAGELTYGGIGEQNHPNFEEWSVSKTSSAFTPPSAVPLPASAWLFGSALMGFIAIKRRKLSNRCS